MALVDPKASPLFAKMRASVERHEEEEEAQRRQEMELEAADEWEEFVDEATQATYYYSPRTGETRWHKPTTDELGSSGEEADGWYYQGTKGEQHGPQPLSTMRSWFEHGHFPEGTMVRRGTSVDFKEVREYHEICGGATEVREGRREKRVEEGVPPLANTKVASQQAAADEAKPSETAALEHPTAGRAQRRSSGRSRTQRRRAGDDSASLDLLTSQLRDEQARTNALQAELDVLRRAHTEEKVRLQAELMRFERAHDARERQSRNSTVRQPCVAIFYEEIPGQPSRVIPIAKARELVETAVIVDGTKVWAEGMLDWRPFRDVKSQMALGTSKAASVAATFFYELGSGEMSEETSTKELEQMLVQLPRDGPPNVSGPAIDRSTKVWTAGLENWKPLREVEHLLICSAD